MSLNPYLWKIDKWLPGDEGKREYEVTIMSKGFLSFFFFFLSLFFFFSTAYGSF